MRAIQLLAALLAANLALVGIYVWDIWMGIPSWTVHQLFDLDAEGTIPAWYTSAQLLLTGVMFMSMRRAGSTSIVPSGFLVLVAGGFAFLSLDEVAGIHEKITVALRPMQAFPRFEGDHGIWIPIYIGIGLLVCGFTAKHWIRLWRFDRSAMLMFFGGVLSMLAGAVVVEVASYGELRQARFVYLYDLVVGLEEFLEMSGASGMLAGAFRLAASAGARSPNTG